MRRLSLVLAVSMLVATLPVAAVGDHADSVRFATFNASLNRFNEGDLANDLSTPDNAQAKVIAEIIQLTRPEVLLINEFDFSEEALDLFRDNYLEVSQNGADPIEYPYAYIAPSNTGVPSGHDLNNDGTVGGPDDAFGFGFFPGQFGMVVYSQHPIGDVRTFQEFRSTVPSGRRCAWRAGGSSRRVRRTPGACALRGRSCSLVRPSSATCRPGGRARPDRAGRRAARRWCR
jgi:3-phytase